MTCCVHAWAKLTLSLLRDVKESLYAGSRQQQDLPLSGEAVLQALQDRSEAPLLPASYSVMALLAFMPMAFFYVMDPRAIEAQQAHVDDTQKLL